MKFVLFSMRDFERDGGGSIRMYGILNALAEEGNEVVFVSNAQNLTKFHSAIHHVNINYKFQNKAEFQGLLGVLPANIIYKIYYKLFKKIETALEKVNVLDSKLIFCEYLDNSIAYVLKKQGVISNYINDLHGIATIEFKYQRDQASNLKNRLVYNLKYTISDLLDKKVFNNGDGFIYASDAMKSYYENIYKKVRTKKAYILPYVLSEDTCERKVDQQSKQSLSKKYNISSNDFVFFFAGGYKPTAGVEDLIQAFIRVVPKYLNLKLMLIGYGATKETCQEIVNTAKLGNQVIFIEKVPYEQLPTYQNLAHVVVCPDRQNPYSELIVHLKYFDSLVSGCLVVNGSFPSVKEINKNDFLSLSFEPSNIDSLTRALENCILNFEDLRMRYKGTRDFTCKHLTYRSFINVLYTKR